MHLSRLFQRSVRMFADRPALARGTAPALTYAALDFQVRALARWLREEQQLQPGDRVVLAMKNCTEYAVAILALWHARLCAVPVNNKLHPSEIDYVLENSGARLCFSQGELHDALRPLAAQSNVELVDTRGPHWQAALAGPALPADAGVHGGDDELAWLFYTSGTTGRPKGVMLSHANLVAMALNFHTDVLPIGPDDVLLHVAPMSHGGGLYGIPYWISGGLQVVPDSGGLDEAELFALLHHYQRASLFAAPTIVTRMVRHAYGLSPAAPMDHCPGLRCLLTGGAPFYVEDIKAAVRCFGPRIAQMYGQGETPMTISALRAEHVARAVAEDDDALLSSVGWEQTGVEVDIVDFDGTPVAPGTLGEVVVRSPTVMLGYWNNPEATAQTVPAGVLHTGDVGLVDERGLLHLKDRTKDVIISGGTNIYPREVEEVLLRHPSVEEVSVIGTPDAEWGEAVTAFVVQRADASVDEAALDQLCIASIARFKRPKHYVFVSQLPKNPTGKVLKSELRKAYRPAA
jgi:long-chain acyl-CoA synthetase